MAARKKAAVCRVQPPVTGVEEGLRYDDLQDGDAFIHDGDIWMKCDCDDQEAIRLKDGVIKSDMCDEGAIIPVDINVTWTLRK